MAIEGELASLDGVTCSCGRELDLRVLRSAAGYYLGYFCPHCGPYSRETGYYPMRQAAEADLAQKTPNNLCDTLFHPSDPAEIAREDVSRWKQLSPDWVTWFVFRSVPRREQRRIVR